MGEIIQFEQRRDKARRLLPMPSRARVPLEKTALKLLRHCPVGSNDAALVAAIDDLGRAMMALIRVSKLPGI